MKNIRFAFFALTVFSALVISSFFVGRTNAENKYISVAGGLGTSGQVLTSTGATTDPSFQNAALPNGPSLNGFRLTLTSNTAVTSADVTAAATVYFTPYTGNVISLYDGSASWSALVSAEVSIALSGLTATMPYDVFVYNNAGTLTIDTLTAWTSPTVRATAITLQNGVYVKNGATTRRYVGTIFTTSTTTTEDTAVRRYVFNYYNQVQRSLFVTEATASWTYTTATVRRANGSTANQVAVICGVTGSPLHLGSLVGASNNLANTGIITGIGINDTTAITALRQSQGIAANLIVQFESNVDVPNQTLGWSNYIWTEYSTATGTTTWYSQSLCGLSGFVFQ